MSLTPKAPTFALDLSERRLYRDRVPLALPPKMFELLRLLVEHPGRLLTKEAILSEVWREIHVSEASVKDYVKELRQLLEDDATAPRYIETVRGRGYRYIGDIRVVGPGAGGPSIAVFPFECSSGDRRDYFSDGIAEDICMGLGRYRELVVLSPFSAFPASERWADLAQAAGALGADWLLTGRVTRTETELVLGVRLLEAGTQRQVWAERYARKLHEVLAVEDEVVRTIVATIVGQVDRAHTLRALGKDPALLSAYELVLQGRARLAKGTQEDVLAARAIFERAVLDHPGYAAGYVWLAESYYLEAVSHWTASAELAATRALELGRRAVELDELDSFAHLMLAWAHFRMGGLEMAKAQLEKALELNPNDYYGLCLQSTLCLCGGEIDGAIEHGLLALRRSPLVSDACLFTLGFAYYFAEEYPRALEVWGRMARPRIEVKAGIAASLARLDRAVEAEAALRDFCSELGSAERARFAADRASFRKYWQRVFPLKEVGLLEHLLAALDRAGLSRMFGDPARP
jgi:adenylate cyclase